MRSNRDRRLRSIGSSSTTSTWRPDDSEEFISPKSYRGLQSGSAPGGGDAADADVVGQHHFAIGLVRLLDRQVDQARGRSGGVVDQLPFDDETPGIVGAGHVLHVPISTQGSR